MGCEQCHVTLQRLFEHVKATVDLAVLLALGEPGPDGNRRVSPAEAGGGGAPPLADNALGHELQLDPAGGIELFKHDRTGTAWKRADDPFYTARREQCREPGPSGTGIVGDHRQIARALLDDRFAQSVGQSRATEASTKDGRA